MDNLTTARNQPRAMREATRESHTWIMSFLYIGTFGSFIGFGFAFGQVLQNQFTESFATPLAAASLTWLGPLLGSLIRPVGGTLADRFGGARITFWNFVAMALGAFVVWTASQLESLPLFVVGFVLLFVFSGIGNGSTYKMIPAIFRTQAQQSVAAGGDTHVADRKALRMSGALIGIAGAVGAFGGVLVNLAFRQSFLTTGSGDSAYLVLHRLLRGLRRRHLGRLPAAAGADGRGLKEDPVLLTARKLAASLWTGPSAATMTA